MWDVGFQLIDGEELFEIRLDKTANTFVKLLSGCKVYLCFYMDFFDPLCAPGVCTPTWGGTTAREGLDFMRKL